MTDGLTTSAHSLRYVLKNRATNEPLFVIVFTLLPKEGEEKDGTPGEGEKTEENKKKTEDDDLD